MAAQVAFTEADELRLAEAVEKYFFDPEGFVEWAFPWGEPDTMLDDERLEDWQRDILQILGRETFNLESVIEICVTSGHGVGKTALVAMIIIWFMATRPHPQCVVTANTKEQLTGKTWRELEKWRRICILGDLFEHTATTYKLRAEPATWFAHAVAWSATNSEAFAGTHETYVLMVFDEASAIDDPIWEVSDGALTDAKGCSIRIAFGNPTKNTGRFRRAFRSNSRIITRKVNSETVNRTNKDLFKRWEEEWGRDSDFYRVRVLGEFPAVGATQLIGNDLVVAAQGREVPEWTIDRHTPMLMGIDVARQGDDRSVFRFRRGAKLYRSKFTYRIANLMHLASYAAEILTNGVKLEGHHYIVDVAFVDATGLGAGVFDRLIQLGHDNVVEVLVGEKAMDDNIYYNKRIEIWTKMRTWLNTADIPEREDDLFEDLIAPEYYFNSKQQMQLERKEDTKVRLGHSPDDGDAVSMTFADAVPTRREDSNPEEYEPGYV